MKGLKYIFATFVIASAFLFTDQAYACNGEVTGYSVTYDYYGNVVKSPICTPRMYGASNIYSTTYPYISSYNNYNYAYSSYSGPYPTYTTYPTYNNYQYQTYPSYTYGYNYNGGYNSNYTDWNTFAPNYYNYVQPVATNNLNNCYIIGGQCLRSPTIMSNPPRSAW